VPQITEEILQQISKYFTMRKQTVSNKHPASKNLLQKS